jgi:hypothetical protein
MIDKFLDRMPSKDYNCLDFVREVWLEIVGTDLKEQLDKMCFSVSCESISLASLHHFTRYSKPVNPCFVVMQRLRLSPHIGIFYNGRILHMTEQGVEYQPIQVAKRYFTKIGYYR